MNKMRFRCWMGCGAFLLAIFAPRVPILLVHGVDDVVVPLSQAEAMARALQEAGKSYRLVKMLGEDHWLSRSESRLTVMKELETFLAANLGSR